MKIVKCEKIRLRKKNCFLKLVSVKKDKTLGSNPGESLKEIKWLFFWHILFESTKLKLVDWQISLSQKQKMLPIATAQFILNSKTLFGQSHFICLFCNLNKS